ncbi:hypothetical protein [Polynucleobacter sp. Fuers-14]|uniref:hypothetical protein n=1 Tax=Polynucleobacter sp. Fuers-14 TaxID=1758364 RepID=UPI001C0DE266|nr:hypothetical protein [Polynucleobacter sp. Fuers-14]MBU3641735.1 hypothetical protein [Polynucleobacter sp. Fuers-14]
MVKKVNLPSEEVTGRSIFVIETIAEGVRVQTAFLTEDGKILQIPAVFPDQEYALAQIDQLREAVIRHFSEAAKVGAKVIAGTAQVGPNSRDTIQ